MQGYGNVFFAFMLGAWGAWQVVLTIRNAWVNPGRDRREEIFRGYVAIALAVLLVR